MRYGLIGEKLSHSYSKTVHALLGDDSYELVSLRPEELAGFLRSRAFEGLNVTIPYKKAVIPFCAELSETARKTGSVNTIAVDAAGRLIGHNTDYAGFLYMAARAGIGFKGKNVLVLGSGGTGVTAVQAASDRGAARVTTVSRNGPVHYGNVHRLSDTEIVVNATPVGMYPEPAAQPLPLAGFPNLEAVIDVIYNPLRTRLLLEAEALGLHRSNGLPMLVAQAKYARDIFTAAPSPDEVIEQAVRRITADTANIILIGMPGSGKSAVGREIARLSGREFIDTDALIEAEYGSPPAEIINKSGEAYFREREAEAVAQAGKEKSRVIATGGGAVLRQENMTALRQNGFIIYLARAAERLARRGRPLSAGPGSLETLLAERLPLYERYAGARVDNIGGIETVAQKALEVFYENIDC